MPLPRRRLFLAQLRLRCGAPAGRGAGHLAPGAPWAPPSSPVPPCLYSSHNESAGTQQPALLLLTRSQAACFWPAAAQAAQQAAPPGAALNLMLVLLTWAQHTPRRQPAPDIRPLCIQAAAQLRRCTGIAYRCIRGGGPPSVAGFQPCTRLGCNAQAGQWHAHKRQRHPNSRGRTGWRGVSGGARGAAGLTPVPLPCTPSHAHQHTAIIHSTSRRSAVAKPGFRPIWRAGGSYM